MKKFDVASPRFFNTVVHASTCHGISDFSVHFQLISLDVVMPAIGSLTLGSNLSISFAIIKYCYLVLKKGLGFHLLKSVETIFNSFQYLYHQLMLDTFEHTASMISP